MTDEPQVPSGAAVFPLIPAELGIHPLLLAVLHSVVFLDGSEEDVIDPDAATEAMEYVAEYLQRLSGPELQRVREDLQSLAAFARQAEWPKTNVQFLQTFLADLGVVTEGEA